LGDKAYEMSDEAKIALRWEAEKFHEGKCWHRWDHPNKEMTFDEQQPVLAMYTTDIWRSFRTWGVSSFSQHELAHFWKPKSGADKNQKEFKVDWDNLQRPGFSPDFYPDPTKGESFLSTLHPSDWTPSVAAQALIRNNQPLLAYIGGKPARFTSKDHDFQAGEAFDKQLIIINNSRQTVACNCEWSLKLPQPITGTKKIDLPTGQQERIPLHFELPASVTAGRYEITATVRFSNNETQTDSFAISVLAPLPAPASGVKIALFDPKGETRKLLSSLQIDCQPVEAAADLSSYDTLIIGKAALTPDGPAPDIKRVRDGLRVILFEQTSDALEQRLGFRVAEYGLRQVYKRIPDHPLLAELDTENLRDWCGEATLVPPRVKMEDADYGRKFVKWCGLDVTQIWRVGCQGNVTSVLIEKPARGDFLPIIDGGFGLQYSPLMEYREGKGMILFCQLDVTGRTEREPAADRLVRNIVAYVSAWKQPTARALIYVGDSAGKKHLEEAGFTLAAWQSGNPGPNSVVLVGPGGDKQLADGAAKFGDWLKAGGRVLTVGLDSKEANSFLPFKVNTKKEEYISTVFESGSAGSLLAGISPADVYNRDPRQLPLIKDGAKAVGDGVLALAEGGNAVFCQLVPWEFEYVKKHKAKQEPSKDQTRKTDAKGQPNESQPYNIKKTFRRSSFLLNRLLANMGVTGSTPVLERLKSPVTSKSEKRWLTGLYLDEPEEWDYPYRAFRW
jgi:hypothetical protein